MRWQKARPKTTSKKDDKDLSHVCRVYIKRDVIKQLVHLFLCMRYISNE